MKSNHPYFSSSNYLLVASVFIIIIIFLVITYPFLMVSINNLCDETTPELHNIIKDSKPVKKFKGIYSEHAIETLVLVNPLSSPLLRYDFSVMDGNATQTLSKSIYVCDGTDFHISLACYQKTLEFPGFISPSGELRGGKEIYYIRNEAEILKRLDSYDCLSR